MEAVHGSVGQSLQEAAAYLEGLLNFEREPRAPASRLGLRAITGLLARIGDPHRTLSAVHVAGSKGKGSTALLLEALLSAAGERVGTFTSPHLQSWTERFRVGGEPIDPALLARAVARLRPEVEALRREAPEHAPTFFDATTAAALLLFHEAGVDRAILEVGLGGRLDSTNVVDPAVCCITSIELEHTDRLGNTLAAIAGEKAGILKPGRPVVVGRLPEPALAVVEARAREVGAPLARLGRELEADVLEAGLGGLHLRVRDGALDAEARLGVLGAHQADNAALAVGCALRLPGASPERVGQAMASGLSSVRLPGRLELVARRPWILVDAAHTEVSARLLASTLGGIPRRATHLVLSVSAGKDLDAILRALVPVATELTLTRAEPRRSLAPADVAAAVRRLAPETALRVIPNPHLAIRSARARIGPEDLLCITGSVYLAGIGRHLLAPRV